jgi:hypothetical protein
MANNRFNKQVTPKGYRKGGPVDKINKAFKPKKKKVKKKKSFPDLNKDGKVTFADVLKGRGVKAKA